MCQVGRRCCDGLISKILPDPPVAAAGEGGPPWLEPFSEPVRLRCQLPGGFTFFRLLPPGPGGGDRRCVSSSTANGEFRLWLDRFGRVSGLTCLYSGYLSAENLAQLYRVHSASLPGLAQVKYAKLWN